MDKRDEIRELFQKLPENQKSEMVGILLGSLKQDEKEIETMWSHTPLWVVRMICKQFPILHKNSGY